MQRLPVGGQNSGYESLASDAKILTLYCFILFWAAISLTGCARSIIKPLPASIDAAELAGISDQKPKESILDKAPEQLINAGFTYLTMGNPQLARLHFQAALQKEPQSAEALLGLGKTENMAGNFALAALYYRRAAELDPTNVQALIGAVQALRKDN